MPAANQPLTTTIAAGAPSVRGITTAAHNARIAALKPASAETLSISPTADDLRVHLGLPPKQAPAASAGDGTETTEEDETPEETTAEDEIPEVETTDEITTEEETPAETEETTDDDTQLPPEAIAVRDSMQKRIDKLTAQKTEAAERLSELETELETARTNVDRPRPTAESPLAHVLTDAELETEIAEAQQTKQWALRNRHGAEIKDKDGNVTAYDADQVANILANAEAQLDAAPARKEWLGHQKASREIGAKLAPEFYTKGSPQQQLLAKVIAGVPAAVRAWRPDIELILVQSLIGAAAMQSAAKKDGSGKPALNAAPPNKVPPAPGGRTAPKAPAKVIDRRATAEGNQRIATGGTRALAAALEKRLFN